MRSSSIHLPAYQSCQTNTITEQEMHTDPSLSGENTPAIILNHAGYVGRTWCEKRGAEWSVSYPMLSTAEKLNSHKCLHIGLVLRVWVLLACFETFATKHDIQQDPFLFANIEHILGCALPQKVTWRENPSKWIFLCLQTHVGLFLRRALITPGHFLSWSQSIHPLLSSAALPVTARNDLFSTAKNFISYKSWYLGGSMFGNLAMLWPSPFFSTPTSCLFELASILSFVSFCS